MHAYLLWWSREACRFKHVQTSVKRAINTNYGFKSKNEIAPCFIFLAMDGLHSCCK